MPTYEYACSSCGNAWEEVQKITEPALEVCPACKKATAKRQISGGSFILKGGGWYADLYSSRKGSAGAKAEESSSKPEAGSAGASSGGGESKSDAGAGGGSKPETKSESKKESSPAPSGSTGPAKAAAQ